MVTRSSTVTQQRGRLGIRATYMSATTKAIETVGHAADPVVHWNGTFYEGSIRGFDPDERQPIAKVPSYAIPQDKRMDMGVEFYSASLKRAWEQYLSGGVTDWSDVSSITVIQVLDQVLSQKWRQYRLIQGIRSIPMADLGLKIDYISTKMAGQQKVPDLVEADIEEEAFTQVTFDLWKNVVHIAKSDRVQKKANHPLMQLGTEQASKALAKMKNIQIGTALETASTQSGTDWGASSGGVSTYDPRADIDAAIDTMEGNDFEPDTVALDPLALSDYESNTWVKAFQQKMLGNAGVDANNMALGNLPGYPQLKLVADTVLTATIGLVYDSTEAFILGQGPVEAATYRNEPAGYDAYIIRDYMQPKKIDANASIKLTGVHA